MTVSNDCEVHLVLILTDEGYEPRRSFDSLIEAKAHAMEKRGQGHRATVLTVRHTPAAPSVTCRCGYTAADDTCDCDFDAIGGE